MLCFYDLFKSFNCCFASRQYIISLNTNDAEHKTWKIEALSAMSIQSTCPLLCPQIISARIYHPCDTDGERSLWMFRPELWAAAWNLISNLGMLWAASSHSCLCTGWREIYNSFHKWSGHVQYGLMWEFNTILRVFGSSIQSGAVEVYRLEKRRQDKKNMMGRKCCRHISLIRYLNERVH